MCAWWSTTLSLIGSRNGSRDLSQCEAQREDTAPVHQGKPWYCGYN
jgi:hypothetical protein